MKRKRQHLHRCRELSKLEAQNLFCSGCQNLCQRQMVFAKLVCLGVMADCSIYSATARICSAIACTTQAAGMSAQLGRSLRGRGAGRVHEPHVC